MCRPGASTLSDAEEAWQVQVTSGRHYAAMRCPDDSICVTPNHYTIHELPEKPTEDCVFPPDLVSYAVSKGWWREGETPFDFAKAYQHPDWVKRGINTRRQAYGTSFLLGREWRDEGCPFSVKAERKVSPEDVMKALSSHPEGVVPHDNGRDGTSLCRKDTDESLVCDFGATPAETVLHLAAQPPCENSYIAVRPLVQPLPAAFNYGKAEERLERHLLPDADVFPRPIVVGIADRCARPSPPQTDYIDALSRAGHIPVLIGRCKERSRMAAALRRVDLLLFSGGEDVCTERYGERRGLSCEPALDRDDFEFALIDEAAKQRKPIFGICRGLQLINVYFGGSLYRDIPAEYEPPAGASRCEHRFGQWEDAGKGPPAHDVVVEKDSRLFAVTGAERLAVNSHHHQGVKRLAPGFRVSARATDGFVEAIEGDDYPAAAVQFHPEALVLGRPSDTRYDLVALEAILKDIGRLCGGAQQNSRKESADGK